MRVVRFIESHDVSEYPYVYAYECECGIRCENITWLKSHFKVAHYGQPILLVEDVVSPA